MLHMHNTNTGKVCQNVITVI